MHVPALLSSARLGRQWSVRLARSYGASDATVHVVELLTSEVVTNAVKYGQVTDAIALGMECGLHELTVSVTDENPRPPVVLDADVQRTGGQGMRVVERLARAGAIVSVDTRKAAVMEATLAAGAHIVNDVAALLWDDRALDVVAKSGCPVVLMHSPDPKKGGHGDGGYTNVLTDVFDWLETRIAAVVAGGVDRSRVIVDPGIGFGKTLAENLALLNGLAIFHGLGCPIMLGASRKRTIGALSGEAPADRRLGGSIALAMKAVEQGAQIVRVHDVFETVQALRVWRGLRDQALTFRA